MSFEYMRWQKSNYIQVVESVFGRTLQRLNDRKVPRPDDIPEEIFKSLGLKTTYTVWYDKHKRTQNDKYLRTWD